jgi:hypothetical protein
MCCGVPREMWKTTCTFEKAIKSLATVEATKSF